MAETWTDPEDYWEDGDVATGALMNTYISNNLKFLKEHHGDHINAATFADLDATLTPAQTNVHGCDATNGAAICIIKRSGYTGNSGGAAKQSIDVGFQIQYLHIQDISNDHSWILSRFSDAVKHVLAGTHSSTDEVNHDELGTEFHVGDGGAFDEANAQGVNYVYCAIGYKLAT